MPKEYKIRTKNPEVFLRVQKGHFATMHSHTNYYIDVTTQKNRLSEAKAVAKEMVSSYRTNTIIDTIIADGKTGLPAVHAGPGYQRAGGAGAHR